MNLFCTYFDSRYLEKGVALYRSLCRHADPFQLWICCFDDRAHAILQNLALPEVVLCRPAQVEAAFSGLAQLREDRSLVEYYFTCSPHFIAFVAAQNPQAEIVTYLDADLWFFHRPDGLLDLSPDQSVLIIPHRFPPRMKYLEQYGKYNVGLVAFRQCPEGRTCLEWWCERCREWCHDRLEPGRYADQKYLDLWPELFAGVEVCTDPGAGLAPWNVAGVPIFRQGEDVYAGDSRLIFYHYHRLMQIRTHLWDPELHCYRTRPSPALKNLVYRPYIEELHRIRQELTERSMTYTGAVPEHVLARGVKAKKETGSTGPVAWVCDMAPVVWGQRWIR